MISLDPKNIEILQILERDGRISNTELASQVNLSPSACLRRVQDLERSGVIAGYKAIIDRRKLGDTVTIFVMVGLSNHLRDASRAFERAMDQAQEVRECHNITGNVEYLLRVDVSSLEHYKTFHSETLGILKQVSSITSYITLATSKG